jgi:hypothetical protein
MIVISRFTGLSDVWSFIPPQAASSPMRSIEMIMLKIRPIGCDIILLAIDEFPLK